MVSLQDALQETSRLSLFYVYQTKQPTRVMISITHHQIVLLNRSTLSRFSQRFLNMCMPPSATSQDATRNDEPNKAIVDFVDHTSNYPRMLRGVQFPVAKVSTIGKHFGKEAKELLEWFGKHL
jgi:hypothetical protein